MKRVSANLINIFRTAQNGEMQFKKLFAKCRSRAELAEDQRHSFDSMVRDRFGRSIEQQLNMQKKRATPTER